MTIWERRRLAQATELAQLEQLQRTRALTREESDRLINLVERERQRGYRLRKQIRAAERKLAGLQARATA
ncbi:hypothetical protein [Sphingomonas aracearum]|uniref:Uncharacterized protein n=1 Tax=Sphingomonas aracearum TaxID=2283317 RepID=A0A369VSZ9_9SPHN|nr:hypothetical protein [Sphingomonas aracearum]RDE04667.1 hypothetical protein DVW87_13830 [Sphingomonas aracearum]